MQEKREARGRLGSLVLGLVLLAGVAALAVGMFWHASSFHGVVIEPPRTAPELPAIGNDGNRFSLKALRGKLVIVSFGYTSCPDVCPLTLSRLKQVKSALGPAGEEIEVAFVSVDPDRDTPERLAAYVNGFAPSFHGLYLDGPELITVLATWNVTASRRDPDPTRSMQPNRNRYYSVDHTSGIFVVDRAGKLRLRYPYDAEVEPIAEDLRRLLAEAGA